MNGELGCCGGCTAGGDDLSVCCDLATAAALELTFPVATVVAQLEVPPAVGHGVKPFLDTPQLGVG